MFDLNDRIGSSRGSTRGVTLMELLVVTVILFVVSAVLLRTLAPALGARRTREAARMFTVMINAARNRALETGRPAGIWLDRMEGLPEACNTVAYAAYPEAYAGDFADSKVEIFTYPDWESTNEQYYLVMVKPVSAGQRDRDVWFSSSRDDQQFVRPGDQLRVSNKRRIFQLGSTTISTKYGTTFDPPGWIIGIGVNNRSSYASGLRQSYDGEVNEYGRFIIHWGDVNGEHVGYGMEYARTPGSFVNQVGQGVPYQIRRQPVKLSSGGIQLPEGTVIDLNWSTVIDSRNWHMPFYVRYDPGDVIGTTPRGRPWLGSGDAPEVQGLNQQPIILMFNEKGAIDNLFSNWWSANSTRWIYRPWRPIRDVYFLVGKRERLPANMGQTTADQLQNNWMDPENLWVMVDYDEGLIASAEMNVRDMFTTVSGVSGSDIKNTGTINSLVETSAPKPGLNMIGTGGLLATSRSYLRLRTVQRGD